MLDKSLQKKLEAIDLC